MNLKFNLNKDNITLSMEIDGENIADNILFIPEKCVDHRGLALNLYASEHGYKLNDFIFDDVNGEIKRGFNYMLNPIYIKRAINNFKNRE